MPLTFDAIYLGYFIPRLDLTEGDGNIADGPGLTSPVNFEFGIDSVDPSPLYTRITSLTMTPQHGYTVYTNDDRDGQLFTANVEPWNGNLPGTTTFDFDAVVRYKGTVTYVDGSSVDNVYLSLMQSQDGQLFLLPSVLDLHILQAKPILSIKPTSLDADWLQLGLNRTEGAFDDGEITGTSGDDVIGAGYVEPVTEGTDRVDNNDGLSGAGTQFNDDVIDALGGNDTVDGGLGDDFIDGGSGDDLLLGNVGNDTILGGEGNDTLIGGAGTDWLDGGAGTDTLSYEGDTAGVTVNLATNTASGGDAQGDSIAHFENVIGGSGNDSLTLSDTAGHAEGGAGDDSLTGGAGNDTLSGGTGADTLTGGGGNDLFQYDADGSVDTITDFGTGNSGAIDDGDATNNDRIDLAPYYDSLREMKDDFADDGILNQSNTTGPNAVDYSDNADITGPAGTGGLQFTGVTSDAFTFDTTGVTCFAAGTRISTPRGQIEVQDLVQGDLVDTVDDGAQPILWIGRRHLSATELAALPHLGPIRIAAGALGTNLPLRDLIVSPQHRVLVKSRIARRMFDLDEVLVAAKHLVGVNGITLAQGLSEVEYWHIMFDRHQVVHSEGAPTESLFVGPEAMKSLTKASRDEILQLMPHLADANFAPARELVKGRLGRTLAARHRKNGVTLYMS
ncbi:Hint domain-containing protein [Paracoccus gahaiensis]|nr:Hint domain-containing protein [Paracoccus gahaiensis]